MALTDTGWAVQVRLPRWDPQIVERLERAGIEALDTPDAFDNHPLEVTMRLGASSEHEARHAVSHALRGWTVLLPYDFVAGGPAG